MHSASPSGTRAMNLGNKVLLWTLLLLLTAIILFYPVRLVCEYRAIEAPHIFENLPLFAALFCAWMVLLLVLAISKPDEANKLDWENLALACIFGLVFWGFWVVITPYGSYADDIWNQGHVRWLLQEGSIPIGQKNLTYFDYPGMHLLVTAISEITGFGVAASRTVFLLANSLIFCGVLYIFLQRVLKSHRLALLGVLLTVMTDTVLVEKMHIFTPGALGFTLLVGLLVVLARSDAGLLGGGVPNSLVMLVLFAAMAISYLANSILVLLILLGVYAVQTLAKDKAQRPSPATISLLATLVFAWAIYWTWHIFDSLTMFLPKIKEQILSGGFLETALRLGASNIGGSLPLWATVCRLAAWGLVVLGTVLGLVSLLRVKRLSLAARIVSGALLGVILLFMIGIFGTEGGYQFSRFLLCAPPFAIPAAMLYLTQRDAPRRGTVVLFTFLAFVLALPCFLSSVNNVSTDAIYRSDVAGGSFLDSHSKDKGADLLVSCISPDSQLIVNCYVPDARLRPVPNMAFYTSNRDAAWAEVDGLAADFVEPGSGLMQQKLFMINEKSKVLYQHLLGIASNDPGWKELEESLSTTNSVYDSQYQELYAARS